MLAFRALRKICKFRNYTLRFVLMLIIQLSEYHNVKNSHSDILYIYLYTDFLKSKELISHFIYLKKNRNNRKDDYMFASTCHAKKYRLGQNRKKQQVRKQTISCHYKYINYLCLDILNRFTYTLGVVRFVPHSTTATISWNSTRVFPSTGYSNKCVFYCSVPFSIKSIQIICTMMYWIYNH